MVVLSFWGVFLPLNRNKQNMNLIDMYRFVYDSNLEGCPFMPISAHQRNLQRYLPIRSACEIQNLSTYVFDCIDYANLTLHLTCQPFNVRSYCWKKENLHLTHFDFLFPHSKMGIILLQIEFIKFSSVTQKHIINCFHITQFNLLWLVT